jgi:hypothetical protein
VAVEKGTKAVILLNLSVFGETNIQQLTNEISDESASKEFFNTQRDYTH